MIARAVRGETKVGYQWGVYLSQHTARIRIIMADVAPENNWKVCADGTVVSKHKVTVRAHLTSSQSTHLGRVKIAIVRFSKGQNKLRTCLQ